MTQAVQMSKQKYSERYDELVGRLYRLALYILGDEYQAECVITNTFVEGYCALNNSRLTFENTMLKRLVMACECCRPVKGKQYIRFFEQNVKDAPPLLRALAKYEVPERAALLLVFVERCDINSVAEILDTDAARLQKSLSNLCFSLRGKLSA